MVVFSDDCQHEQHKHQEADEDHHVDGLVRGAEAKEVRRKSLTAGRVVLDVLKEAHNNSAEENADKEHLRAHGHRVVEEASVRSACHDHGVMMLCPNRKPVTVLFEEHPTI